MSHVFYTTTVAVSVGRVGRHFYREGPSTVLPVDPLTPC